MIGARVPLHQAKAEFFRLLGHPARIRVLELLQDGPKPVRELLAAIEIEPSSLSQQLAVLRRAGIVTSVRQGSTVVYELAGVEVAALLRVARRVLEQLLAGQQDLLMQMQAHTPAQTQTRMQFQTQGTEPGRMPDVRRCEENVRP